MDNDVLKAVAGADTSRTRRKLAARFEVTFATKLAHLNHIGKVKKLQRQLRIN